MRVTCMICKWEGTEAELIIGHLLKRKTTGPTEELIKYCPQCGNRFGLHWIWNNMATGLDRGGTVAYTSNERLK